MPLEADYNFGKRAVKAERLRQDQLEECVEILVALERVGSERRLWDVVRRKGYMTSTAIAEIRNAMTGPESSGLVAASPPAEETSESPRLPPRPAQEFLLVHVRAGGPGKPYPLPMRAVTIGKDADCDIVLPEPGVKSHHARLRISEESYMVEDLTRGGIMVNGLRVGSRALGAYDLIELGDALLLFLPEPGDQPAPEPMEAETLAGSASARLRIVEGARKGAGFLLGPRSLVIGRSRLANVRLPEPDVSEFHAHVTYSLQGCRLTDLSGPAGTKVNGLSVSRQVLNEGDNLSIGSVTFAFHALEAVAAPGTEGVEPSLKPAGPAPGKKTALRREAEAGAERGADWDIQEEVEVEPMTDPMMRRGMNLPRGEPPAAPALKAYKPGQIQLIFAEGPLQGRKLLLVKRSTMFGRGGGADVELPDASVSRRHAEIAFKPRHTDVRDLRSRNGTFLNGARVSAAPLRPGDSVRMGTSVLVVEEVSPGPRPRENP